MDERRAIDRETRAALAGASGQKKLDLVLSHPEPQRLVRSLPAEDLFLAISEIGLADAEALVQLASPEQFRTFVDLDAFRGLDAETGAPLVDAPRLLTWLAAARGDDDAGYKAKLDGLDLEVVELLLRSLVKIVDLEEDPEPAEDEGTVEKSPEGRFLLVYADAADYAAARRLVADLYADDPFRAGRMLYAVRHELESELAETAYRWRNARLADLGFPSPEEAASLFARVPLDATRAAPATAEPPAEPPGFFLAAVTRPGSLFDRALAAVPEEGRERLERQLVAVLNMALVGDRVDVADVEAVREEALWVRDTLSLGLQRLAGDDPAAAATKLPELPLKRLFQLGFTLALELKHAAEALARELPLRLAGATAWLPDTPDGEVLAALLGKRPKLFVGLLEPGSLLVRGFANAAELEAASAALERLRLLGEVFAEAGLSPKSAAEAVTGAEGPAGLARVRWSDLFLTAAAREAAGAGFAFAALDPQLLPEAVRRAFVPEGGKLRDVFRELASDALLRWAEQLTPRHEAAARTLAASALARLEEDLGPAVAAGGVDPRHAAPWIVAR